MIPFKEADRWRIDNGYASMSDINTGGCECFAQAFVQCIPAGELVGTDNFVCWEHTEHWCSGHIWIYDGKHHYDSQALLGVSDWKDLPFFITRLRDLKEIPCGCPQISLTKN